MSEPRSISAVAGGSVRALMGPSVREEHLEAELYFLRSTLQGYLAWLKEEQGDFMAGSGYIKMAKAAEAQFRATVPPRFLVKVP